MNKIKVVACFVFVVAFGLTTDMPAFSAEKPLIIAFEGDAVTFDPHGRNETTTTTIQRHFYSQLISFDKDLKPSPDLAVSWKLIDDLTWEFKLRQGVKFHNGEPFNAAAVKYSLERCKTHPKSQYKYMVPDYKEIVAVDDDTIRFVTKEPTPETLTMLESISMVPPKYFKEWDAKDYAHLTMNPVGTGPYRFIEWVKDSHIKMVANPDWYGGEIDFKEVVIRPIPEDATRVAALVSGEVDAVWGVSIPDIPRVEKNKETYIALAPSYRSIFLMFDVFCDKGGPAPGMQPGIPAGKPNPFKDIRVRKAIAHAINVDEIIKYVMEGSAYPASQLISPHTEGHNPNLQRPRYDPELAKNLLAEAGYGEGFEANFNFPNDRYINDDQVSEAITAQLNKNLGLRLKPVAQPKAVFFPMTYRFESPMFLLGWGTLSWQGTMDTQFRKMEGSYGRGNRARLYDPVLEKRIDEANTTMDEKKRIALRHAVSAEAYAHFSVLPLYYQENVMGFSKRIKDGTARVDERLFAFEMKKAK